LQRGVGMPRSRDEWSSRQSASYKAFLLQFSRTLVEFR
jgi:hypothetical protein